MFKNKRGILFTWLVSYVSILMIPIIAGVINYLIADRVLREQINTTNMLALENVVSRVDKLLIDNERLSNEIMLDKNIRQIEEFTPETMSRGMIPEAIRSLNINKFNYGVIAYVSMIFPAMDTVVTSEGSSSMYQYFTTYFEGSDVTYEDFNTLIGNRHNGEYIVAKRTASSEGNMILYAKSVPWKSNPKVFNTLIVTLYEQDFIDEFINSRFQGNGAFEMQDGRGESLVRLSYDEVYPTVMGKLYADKEIQTVRVGKQKYTVAQSESKVGSYHFYYMINERVFFEKKNAFRQVAFVGGAVCLILGIVTIVFFAKLNYNPVKKIIHQVSRLSSQDKSSTVDEYEFIKKSIEMVDDERKRITYIFDKQSRTVQQYQLYKLLLGFPNAEYNMTFQWEYFAVLLICMDDFSGIYFDSQGHDISKSYSQAQFIITNILTELLGGFSEVYNTEINSQSAFLLNFESASGIEEKMKEAVSNAKYVISNEFNIEFGVAVSKVQSTESGISAAYREASDSMEYRFMAEMDGDVFYSDISMEKYSGSYYYPIEVEQKLMNCIKAGDEQNAKQILDEIFDTNYDASSLSLQMMKCLQFNIIGTMIRTVSDMAEKNDEQLLNFIEKLKPIEGLLACETTQRIQDKMIEILGQFCAYINSKTEVNSSTLYINRAKAYIKENYSDPNLYVIGVAEHLKLHPDYLSKTFKAQTGVGLLDYISNVRMNDAKEQLMTTELTISQIALNVGYTNLQTFTRVFKRVHGTTPSRYRKNTTD